jgi:pimeloyl-ACP methyl ester carboxylesterase
MTGPADLPLPMAQPADNCRRHGTAPFAVVVVHGGPGAPGAMAPVAREVSRQCGVLEPLQTADSVEGQIEELASVCRRRGAPPVTLIGHSWGAWLSLLTAARHPEVAAKLMLVGCGPLTAQGAARIMDTRLARLTDREQSRLHDVLTALHTPGTRDRNALLAELGAIMDRADIVDPLPPEPGPTLPCQERLFQAVWPQAEALRREGGLIEAARRLRCPVLVVHGADDPHPAAGVVEPLAAILKDFRAITLATCGHTPWRERQAADAFYRILRDEIL